MQSYGSISSFIYKHFTLEIYHYKMCQSKKKSIECN